MKVVKWPAFDPGKKTNLRLQSIREDEALFGICMAAVMIS